MVAVLVVTTAPPVTIPDEEPIVATVVAPLTHVPPVSASLNEVVRPAQTVRVPSMAVGKGLTVTTSVA